MEVDRLFVYGTLLPGHLRWGLLAGSALRWEDAVATGVLWDTGNGWPAAQFAGGVGSVPGAVVEFERSVLDRLLASLDAMEGIGDPPDPAVDPYVRVRVPVRIEGGADSAVEAWTYDATRVGSGWRAIERWEGRPER